MTQTDTKPNFEKIVRSSELLYAASRTIRILTFVSWPQQARDEFFRRGEKELPEISYSKFDAESVFEKVAAARKEFDGPPQIRDWLEKIASQIETSAMMLAAAGTKEFYRYSRELYGAPKDTLTDSPDSSLNLAELVDSLFSQFKRMDLGHPVDATLTADELAQRMTEAAHAIFGDFAPNVFVVDELSANALAGPSRIRIRRGATFTDRDLSQLINHEAHIHVATALNGIHQPYLKILAAAHPGSTRTQEGLAVFAEFITGSMDLDRLHRLADRVVAIQMAIEGADFLQVFDFFRQRIPDKVQAYESTRRVFRGGVLSGSAPFTKDIVYLDGLLRVHNFLRTMVAAGRPDSLRLLFCGKIDIEDLPVLAQLYKLGLCVMPKFLPPWATDIRFLLCYLTYSSFLNEVDLSKVKLHYRQLLESMPRIQ